MEGGQLGLGFESQHRWQSEHVAYVPNELLSRLVGMRLLSIEFILDYVVVHFDGDPSQPQAVLECDVMPQAVGGDGSRRRKGDEGYADALCSLIGHVVTATGEGPRSGLRIEIEGRGALILDPGTDELTGPEIALLSGFPDGAWMCWRPGEEAFEHLR